MTMTPKEFAELAIKNGYTDKQCQGWDWIRANIHLLDEIFRSTEYKEANGMKYKCEPFLITENMDELEKRAITTAWYLNNERERKEAKERYNLKMISEGYLQLDEALFDKAIKENKRIDVVAHKTGSFFTSEIKTIMKPIRDAKGLAFLVRPRCRRTGYYLTSLENPFCKLV